MTRRLPRAILAALLALPGLPAAAQPIGTSPALTAAPEPSTLTVRGSVYVPAYTSLVVVRNALRINLTVSLAIHNASGVKPLVVERIAYHNTAGDLVEDHLNAPVALRPFGTLEVNIPATDERGGTGASFVVDWAAAGPIAEPVMETLILGSSGTQGFSFVAQGRPIRIIGERP